MIQLSDRYGVAAGPVRVLLADDDPTDIELFLAAFRKIESPVEFTVVHDGVEALAALRGHDSFAKLRRPNKVVLDLKMPMKSGLEVLREMRADRDLAAIPVTILSNSMHQDDILNCYAAAAQAYIVKPERFGELVALAETLTALWTRFVVLP